MLDGFVFGKSLAYGIEFLRVFMRTYGKRGTVVLKAVLLGVVASVLKSQSVANATPILSLGAGLKTFDFVQKLLRIIRRTNRVHVKTHFFDEPFEFTKPFFPLFFAADIGIIKIQRNIEIVFKILKAIATARSATSVQKQSRLFSVKRRDDFIELKLIIHVVIHTPIGNSEYLVEIL